MLLSSEYMAGFFDGEGCVTVITQRRKGRRAPDIIPRVSVTNVDRRVLDSFAELFGGNVFEVKVRGARKRAYRWDAPRARAVLRTFVQTLRPHVIIKADQLDALSALLACERIGRGYTPLSEEIFAARVAAAQAIRAANMRISGIAKPLLLPT